MLYGHIVFCEILWRKRDLQDCVILLSHYPYCVIVEKLSWMCWPVYTQTHTHTLLVIQEPAVSYHSAIHIWMGIAHPCSLMWPSAGGFTEQPSVQHCFHSHPVCPSRFSFHFSEALMRKSFHFNHLLRGLVSPSINLMYRHYQQKVCHQD